MSRTGASACGGVKLTPKGGTARTLGANYGEYGTTFWEEYYKPSELLAASTTYTVSTICASPSWSYEFTTGTDVDGAGPRLISVSPDPNAKDANPFGPFILRFDRPLLTSRGVVSATNGLGYTINSVDYRLTADRLGVEVRPQYQDAIAPVVLIRSDPAATRDLCYNPGRGTATTTRFVTSLITDASGPQVLGTYPEAGENSVPTNAAIQILFDRAVNSQSAANGGIVLEQRGEKVTIQTSSTNSQLVVLTGVTLLPNTTYRVRVTTNMLDSNGIPANQEVVSDFTTSSGPDSAKSSSTLFGPSTKPAPTNASIVLRSPHRLPSFVPLLMEEGIRNSDGNEGSLRQPVTARLQDGGKTLVITPVEPLPAWASIWVFKRVFDITGTSPYLNQSFDTGDQADTTPPTLATSTPSDGDNAVPVNTTLRFVLNEPVGLMTPESAIRLTRDGQTVDGQIKFSSSATSDQTDQAARAVEFTPAAALDAETAYEITLDGVADVAGNLLPTQKIHFQTAADSTAPAAYPYLVTSSLDGGWVGPFDPILLEFSQPLKASKVVASVTVSTSRPGNSPVAMPQPVRVEVSNTTVRIVPLLSWPAKQTISVVVSGEDRWARSISYSNTFQAIATGDTDRPEVLSITPDDGTTLTAGQPIRITFSEAMLNTSQINDGITLHQADYTFLPSIYWSDDRTTVTVVPFLKNTGTSVGSQPLTLAVTSALTDLAGNPAKAFTARYLANVSSAVSYLPTIVKSWPTSGSSDVDVRSTLTLYLSRPADVDQFNRSLMLVSPNGRVAGTWRISADGLFVTFQPEPEWPSGSQISLKQVDSVLDSFYLFYFSTAAVSSDLTVVRTSLRSSQPADAVLDVEFNQDLPSGPGPLRLQTGGWSTVDVPFDELRPRPNVIRLVPRTAVLPGNHVRILPKADATLSWSGCSGAITAATNPPTAELRYRSPLPESTGMALNTRISAVFTTELNEISATTANLTLSTGGATLPATLIVPTDYSSRLTIAPAAMLPANSKIDVTLAGLEDRTGHAIPTVTWSFTTGDAIDVTKPTLLYSNANSLLDPQASLELTFDKPIDSAFNTQAFNTYQTVQWSLSSDLRTLYLLPPNGWKRGESNSITPTVSDWAGNQSSSISVTFQAGFDADTTAPVLRAASIRDGQTGLPLNPVFALLFNKPLGATALRSVRLTSENGDVPLSTKKVSGNRLTLAPPYLLAPRTNYQLVIEDVQDASGNVMADRTVISFTTGEILNEATTKATYRIDSISEPLIVRFSQAIDITWLADAPQVLTTFDLSGSTSYTVTIPVDITWSDDRTLLTITPKQSLEPGKSYTLSLSGVTGSAGSALSLTSYSFTPAKSPDHSPIRVAISPVDGSAAVPLNVALQVYFSRAPLAMPVVRLYENDALVPVTLSSSYWGYSISNLVTIQRTLKAGQRYRIEVDGFRDELDSEIAATSSTFTTGTASNTSSFGLTSSTPANDEAGVSLDTPLVLTFNLPLAPLSFIGSPLQSSRTIPFAYTSAVSGSRLTFSPTTSWPAASTISLYLDNYIGYTVPTITSWTGKKMSMPVSLHFRTVSVNDPTPPVLESADPPSGSTIPGGKAIVTLRFSKPVMLPSTGLQIFYGADKAVVTGAYSQDSLSVTYTLRPPANSRVTMIGTSDIRDNADNPLDPFVLEYDTGESAPIGSPTATLTEPSQAWSVPANTNITVRFDRVMDSGSVLAALRITENGQNKEGAIEVLEEGRAYRFHPSAPFSASSTVKVFLLATAQDTTGQFITTTYNWPKTLSIASSTSTQTSLVLTQRGFQLTAPIDSTLEFELSADLDSSSVNEESVWLRKGSSLVAGEVSLRDGRIVQFRPKEPLEAGADYVLTAGSALRDIDGRQFAGQDLSFRAIPAGDSADVESVTETEWEGRRALRVRFTGPVSPLAVHGLSLDLDGRAVSSETRRTTDASELLLIPDDASVTGALNVNVERVPGANGRLLPFRRTAVSSRSTSR